MVRPHHLDPLVADSFSRVADTGVSTSKTLCSLLMVSRPFPGVDAAWMKRSGRQENMLGAGVDTSK